MGERILLFQFVLWFRLPDSIWDLRFDQILIPLRIPYLLTYFSSFRPHEPRLLAAVRRRPRRLRLPRHLHQGLGRRDGGLPARPHGKCVYQGRGVQRGSKSGVNTKVL